jgi:hypothetical protein
MFPQETKKVFDTIKGHLGSSINVCLSTRDWSEDGKGTPNFENAGLTSQPLLIIFPHCELAFFSDFYRLFASWFSA